MEKKRKLQLKGITSSHAINQNQINVKWVWMRLFKCVCVCVHTSKPLIDNKWLGALRKEIDFA